MDPAIVPLLAADLLNLLEDACSVLQLHCTPAAAATSNSPPTAVTAAQQYCNQEGKLEVEILSHLYRNMEESFK